MLEIQPQEGVYEAVLEVPGSKSISNRALILAALSKGETELSNLQFSDDSRRMLVCLKHLGFEVDWNEEAKSARVRGQGGQVPGDSAAALGKVELYVGNAGT